MLTLNHLLEIGGLPQNARVKILRHSPSHFSPDTGWHRGWLTGYERSHAKTFSIPDYFVTTIPHLSGSVRFLWVNRVLGKSNSANPFDENFPFKSLHNPEKSDVVDLERLNVFDEFEGRVILDWGRGTRGYHQWLDRVPPKRILQILPANSLDSFPGYNRVLLKHHDLKTLTKSDGANLDWKAALSAVAGVYLITNQSDGRHYVGSAYGTEGILGRFHQYARNGHGGNVQLKKVVNSREDAVSHLEWSILETLPISSTSAEVIMQENFQKQRLGSRAFGLNGN